jgi:hypothetical protein
VSDSLGHEKLVLLLLMLRKYLRNKILAKRL